MAPGGKAAEDIGLEPQDDPRAKHRPAADQRQGGKIPGAEIRDDQERDKEDGRRTEIAHQAQKADADAGQQDEEGQIPPPEQPLQRGRAGEDITDLGDLRGLERQPPNGNPVHRAVFGVTQHQRDPQKTNGRRGHEPAGFLHPGEIPEKDAQHQKQPQPKHNGKKLLEKALRGTGGRHRQAEGGEEKSDGLHLKAHTAGTAQNGKIGPHHRRQPQEGQGNRHWRRLSRRYNQLQARQQLEHRQP